MVGVGILSILIAESSLFRGAAFALNNTSSTAMDTKVNESDVGLVLTESEKQQIQPYDLEIARDPGNAVLYYHRGLSYSILALTGYLNGGGKPRRRKAIEDFSTALKIEPTNRAILLHRAKLFEELEQFDKALDDYKTLLALNPADAEAFYQIGYIYEYCLKDAGKAIPPLNSCISIDPYYSDAHLTRGIAQEEVGASDKALADFTKAIELNPQNDTAYFYRGRLFEKLGQADKAKQDGLQKAILSKSGANLEFFNGVIAEQPDNIAILYRRAKRLSLEKQYRSALNDLTQIIKLKPDSPEAFYLRAKCWVELQDQKKAIEDFTAAIDLDPNGAQALHWKDSSDRTVVYLARGMAFWGLMIPYSTAYHQKALADFTTAISLGATGYSVYLDRAAVYGELNEFYKQIADLNKAISLEPRMVRLYESRARAYDTAHQYEKAILDWTKAIELMSENSYQRSSNFGDPKHQLARTYASRGLDFRRMRKREKASDDFSKAISLNPSISRTIESDLRLLEGRY